MYSPERVSTFTRWPMSTKSGTLIVAPVSSVAGLLPPPEAVSPRRPGSVCVTSSSTEAGSWRSDGLPSMNSTSTVSFGFVHLSASDLQLPASVELEVTQTDPGLRGDTASGGGNKPATLETGATIQVPLFVNIGDRVKVQTETGQYMSRA